uniref:Uncharacterized protein n=1 Tax=Romanomermis culicivorax TaxID=13658 RepID=A0A915J086_ROMCU
KEPAEIPENIHNAFVQWEQKHYEAAAPETDKTETTVPKMQDVAVALKEQLKNYEQEVSQSQSEEDTIYEKEDVTTTTTKDMTKKKKKKKKKRAKPLREANDSQILATVATQALDDKLPYQRQSLSSSFELSGESLDSLSATSTTPADSKTAPQPGATGAKAHKAATKERKKKPKPTLKVKGAKGTIADLMSIDFAEEFFISTPDIVKEILEDAKEPQGSSGSLRAHSYTPQQIAEMSKNREKEFAALLKANTKEMLFTSQATAQETDNWAANVYKKPSTRGTRPRLKHNPVVESRDFCYLCTPRHWKNVCKKHSSAGDFQDAQEHPPQ